MKRALVFNVGPGPTGLREHPDGTWTGTAGGGWSQRRWYRCLAELIEQNAGVDVAIAEIINAREMAECGSG